MEIPGEDKEVGRSLLTVAEFEGIGIHVEDSFESKFLSSLTTARTKRPHAMGWRIMRVDFGISDFTPKPSLNCCLVTTQPAVVFHASSAWEEILPAGIKKSRSTKCDCGEVWHLPGSRDSRSAWWCQWLGSKPCPPRTLRPSTATSLSPPAAASTPDVAASATVQQGSTKDVRTASADETCGAHAPTRPSASIMKVMEGMALNLAKRASSSDWTLPADEQLPLALTAANVSWEAPSCNWSHRPTMCAVPASR